MAYKVLDTALTTSTEALYMFVADNEEDIPNLPNMEQTGSETNTRWYAKAGSVVRVVATGRFYSDSVKIKAKLDVENIFVKAKQDISYYALLHQKKGALAA